LLCGCRLSLGRTCQGNQYCGGCELVEATGPGHVSPSWMFHL
jgi:hypothetical protein